MPMMCCERSCRLLFKDKKKRKGYTFKKEKGGWVRKERLICQIAISIKEVWVLLCE